MQVSRVKVSDLLFIISSLCSASLNPLLLNNSYALTDTPATIHWYSKLYANCYSTDLKNLFLISSP